MAQHQTPASKVQPAITKHARRGINPTVRVDRHHDVTKTRQTFCEISVPRVTRHRNIARRARTGESVLNVNVKVLAGASEAATRGVVAVQQNQKGMGRTAQTGRPIDSPPKFSGEGAVNHRVNCRGQFVFGNCNRPARERSRVRSSLRGERCRQKQQAQKNTHSFPPD